MNKENEITLTIKDTAFGSVIVPIKWATDGEYIIEVPRSNFYGTSYTSLDLKRLVESDIKNFEKLNEHSDEDHQVYIDTLCIYGISISGQYIRIEYWFHQDNDPTSHRMCAGQFTYFDIHRAAAKDGIYKVFNGGYSPDCCVYW